jgi:hypothetical protein
MQPFVERVEEETVGGRRLGPEERYARAAGRRLRLDGELDQLIRARQQRRDREAERLGG